jgi:hypothetical protein
MYERRKLTSKVRLALAQGEAADLAGLTNAELDEGLSELDWVLAMLEIRLIGLRAELDRRAQLPKEVGR